MLTFTGSLALYQTFTKNTSADNQTLGATNLNDSIRTVCSINGGKWPFLEVEETIQTIANRESVTVPNNIRKVMSFRYVQGTLPNSDANVIPRMLFDSAAWERVLAARLGTSSWPAFAYQQDRTLLFRPIPAADNNQIALRGRVKITDLAAADYTTGTIASVPLTATFTGVLASAAVSATLTVAWALPTGLYTVFFSNGEQRVITLTLSSTAVSWTTPLIAAATADLTVGTETGGAIVTGDGTTFTANMIDRWLRITDGVGDGAWYQIGNFYSSTIIGLKTPYQGTDISAATAPYLIGQSSIIPETYQIAPIYRAAALYWGVNNPGNPNTNLANYYWRLYDGGVEAGLSREYGGLISQMQEEANESQEGPYMSPLPLKGGSEYGLPFYNPWQQAGGL